jgi:hypothetical protein
MDQSLSAIKGTAFQTLLLLNKGLIAFFVLASCAGFGWLLRGVYFKLSKKVWPVVAGKKWLLPVYAICMLAAFTLEITMLNYPHWISFAAKNNMMTTGSSAAIAYDNIVFKDGAYYPDGSGSIVFNDVNSDVLSLYIDMVFTEERNTRITIAYTDENSTRQYEAVIYKHLPYSRYININPLGKVSNISITFSSGAINEITLNKPIPLNILALRVILLSVLFFTAFVFICPRTRQKIKTLLFSCPFREHDKKQRGAYLALNGITVLFCLVTVLSTLDFGMETQYNRYLVDAFLDGRLYLDLEVSPEMLAAERPYDTAYRDQNNIPYEWDFAYFEGKYYSYFGVVPVIILFLPFKLLSGHYLPTSLGVFLFSSLTYLFLLKLWKEIVVRYLKKMPFVLFLVCALCLVFCSGILYMCRRPRFYEIAVTSALMFCVLGLLLLFQASFQEKNRRKKLFFACLSFALAVGCRPVLLFASLFVMVYVYNRALFPKPSGSLLKEPLPKNSLFKDILVIAVPYALIAVPLAWYNHARFGSIMEFGSSYQLTVVNMRAYGRLNPLAQCVKLLAGFCAYLFRPLRFQSGFPFVRFNHESVPLLTYVYNKYIAGLINFPVFWALLKIRRVSRPIQAASPFLWSNIKAMFLIAALLISAVTLSAGIHSRYTVDFTWLLLLPSLICVYFIYACSVKTGPETGKIVLTILYLLCAVSIAIGFFLSLTGEDDLLPAPAFHYLEQSFGFIRY